MKCRFIKTIVDKLLHKMTVMYKLVRNLEFLDPKCITCIILSVSRQSRFVILEYSR